MITGLNGSSDNAIFGGRMYVGYYFIGFLLQKVSCRFQGTTGGGMNYSIQSVINRTMNVSIDYPSKLFYIDGESMSMGTVDAPSGPLNLFDNGYRIGESGVIGRCYFVKIYSEASLIADFVPCTNPSGVAGMYDLVTNAFYPSSSSTAFTAGPSV